VLVIKPRWVSHGGTPIFSLDIDASGSKFATCGSDNKVRIWNAAPLRDEALDASDACPKLLALLDQHTKAVNCVRFAPTGFVLASAGDDQVVFVWQLALDSAAFAPRKVFGASDDALVHEKWHARLSLRAHAGDVVDLAWAPAGDLLVSCSLSQELFVWHVAGDQRDAAVPVARLVGHEGMIKGVAWDPIGRYVASACDDRTVRVWRVADWGQEAAITTPFVDSNCNTYFRRLSWSPDGQNLTCAGGVNNKVAVAVVIERGQWTSSRNLVGHRQAVVAASWNPAIFQSSEPDDDDAAAAAGGGAQPAGDAQPAKKKRGSKKRAEYAICAVGSVDNGLSIWTTHMQRSIMVVTNVHNQSVVDLAWDRSTNDMLGCASVDGTVSFYLFKEKDIGVRLPSSTLRDRLRGLYGDAAGPISVLPEDPDVIIAEPLHPQLSMPPPTTTAAAASLRAAHPSPVAARVVSEQTVTMVGGKRRINPATLVADVPSFATSSTTAPPAAVVYHTAATSSLAPLPASTASNSSFAQALATAPLVKPASAAKTVATVTAPSPAAVPQKRKRIEPRDINEPQQPAAAAAAAAATTAAAAAATTSSWAVGAGSNGVFWLHSSAPPLRVVRQVSVPGEQAQLLLEAEVTLPSANAPQATSVVQCVHGTQLQWTVRMPHRVTHVAGTASWTAIGCDDGTLLLRSSKGRLLVPALVLDAPLVALEASPHHFLLAVTADGGVAVWRVGSLTRTVTSSIRSLFASGGGAAPGGRSAQQPHIASASVGDDGVPIVTLPTYESFVFHTSMQAWMRVVDRRHLRSEHASVLPLTADEQLPLGGGAASTVGAAVVQLREDAKRSANVSAELIAAGRALLAPRGGPMHAAIDDAMSASVEHLEHRLAAALLLGPAAEQKRWVRIYARNAANAGLHDRLHELLAALIGRPPAQFDDSVPAAASDAARAAAPPVAALDQSEADMAHRREMWQLAREALSVIRSVRPLQRLYTEFSDQLRHYDF
jgi:protein HIRA/HIR1